MEAFSTDREMLLTVGRQMNTHHFMDFGISWFFDGMLASGSVWAINSIIEWFEENRPKKQ